MTSLYNLQAITVDDKYVNNALYFMVHNKNHCASQKFNKHIILNSPCSEICINIQPNYDNEEYYLILFYDNNGDICDKYISSKKDKLNTNDIFLNIYKNDNAIFELAEKYLDPNAKYDVVGIRIGSHPKVNLGLYFNIKFGDKIETNFISEYDNKDTTLDAVLTYVNELKKCKSYDRYDLSKIKRYNITIEEPLYSCIII